MATLREVIEGNIATLEAEAAAVKAKYEEDAAALTAKIDEARTHLTTFGTWLEQEATIAKDAITELFAKFGL